jgi:amino acid transporter
VFTPTLLTILGVILFMRANYVLGQGGILLTLVILLGAKSIVLLTSLSISAIATNTKVRGGGAYFLISRSLGPEFGGAIGLTLYLAQALSVPFYVIGFVSALVASFPALAPNFQLICLLTVVTLFGLAYVGAEWAIRVQYLVLAVLLASIVSFLLGALIRFDPELLRANLPPAPGAAESGVGFWVLFAIYFPAVTGVMTGVNMSGDLRDASQSIPRGTLAAVGIATVIYGAQILLCGAALPRGELITRPYESLVGIALFGAGFVVAAGVFAATISSAIGSLVAAPRVLQALARDEILNPVAGFAVGSAKRDEPRRAMWLTLLISVGVILVAGGGEADSLNQVAAVVSMFFLAAYGVTNLAAFVEAAGANPSFRPRFRYFHWSVALLGALGCVAASLLIDPLAAAAAGGVIFALWYYVRRRGLTMSFGDARRGYVYTRVRNNLLRLREIPPDPKNWRPAVLVLSGNPNTRLTMASYGVWLEAGRGVVSLVQILVGDYRALQDRRRAAHAELQRFVAEQDLALFPETLVVSDFDDGLRVALQAHSVGPLKPNIVLFGWYGGSDRVEAFFDHLHCADDLGMSLLVMADRGLPSPPERGRRARIDIWWRGHRNGSLMLILGHLLVSNPEWAGSRMRVLRAVGAHEQRAAATEELQALVEAARIDAEVEVVVSDQPFADTLHGASRDAQLVLLGFQLPERVDEVGFQRYYQALIEGLPTTLLVHSSGDADLSA